MGDVTQLLDWLKLVYGELGRIDGYLFTIVHPNLVLAALLKDSLGLLVRVWGEPPLVREPDITLFGLERIDPPEQEFLNKSPMRRVLAADVQRIGAERAAKEALEHLHATAREFGAAVWNDVRQTRLCVPKWSSDILVSGAQMTRS